MFAVYLPDVLRIVTIVALWGVVLTLPWLLHMHNQPHRFQLLVAGVICFIISGIKVIADHWGEPLSWERTPLLLGGSILFVAYVVAAVRAGRHRP